MFFRFNVGEGEGGLTDTEAEKSPLDNDVNEDGSPKYIIGPEDELIINDPTLLLSREQSAEPPTKEDLSKTYRFAGLHGWLPLLKFKIWAQ